MLLLAACEGGIGDRYVGFAECLNSKGVKMYGAYWCPHCANQKKLFGAQGFEKITYIECDPRGANANPELCKQKNVKGFPTWELPGGKIVTGEQTLDELSQNSSCPLPKETPATK